MNTKEALNFIHDTKAFIANKVVCVDTGSVLIRVKKLDKVAELLQRGEKYEAMWGEFGKVNNYDWIVSAMMGLEQKYFLKSKDIRQRINDMLDNLNTMGRAVDIKDLTNLLIEIRDKESDDA